MTAVADHREPTYTFALPRQASVFTGARPCSLRTNSKHRATSCSHARFLRNAIADEAAAPSSSFEARERID
jgi:hypothetical protein